jgi:O-antigen biosynthesis protein
MSSWYDQLRLIRKGLKYGQEVGFSALGRRVWQRMRQHYTSTFAKQNVLSSYAFLKKRPVGSPLSSTQVPRNTLNWVVPPFGRGSGGHLNIFRYVYHLEALGFESRIIIEGEPQPVSAEQTEQEIHSWFFPIKAKVYLGTEKAPPAYVTLATSWPTAYAVRDFLSTVERIYFVQDFEPWFYPTGSEYAFAEETYKFGFFGITAGQWLADKLSADYGMVTRAVGFSYDTDLYRPLPKREQVRQVFFYARPPTARRGFELGLLTLAEVTKKLPDVRIVLAGWDLASYEIPFNHVDVGTLSLAELPDLYSQCDVALVLSFSNLSLLPLELMACGVPVVSNRAPCVTWLLNDENAKLAEPTPKDLARAICDVLENKQEHQRLRDVSLQTAQGTSWRAEAEKMAKILEALTSQEVRS